jgi:hypothetical protein
MVAMFVIVDLQTAYHIQCLSTFMVYLRAKFHMPSSSNSLVIVIKPKAKENFCTAATSLFYVLEKRLEQKLHNFQRSITLDLIRTLN